MLLILLLIVFLSIKSTSLVEVSCPVPWWYCLNRDPKVMSQVKVIDTSNRSITWNWNTGSGDWNIAYDHSFQTGEYSVKACYSWYQRRQPACVSYSKSLGWKSNKLPVQTTGWDISYNGDSFGFQPTGINGQYFFHLYTRNLHYNPFLTNGIETNAENTATEQSDSYGCRIVAAERTQGDGWWLERKSLRKCPIKVNVRGMTSPKEWFWNTEAGKWKVTYSWSSRTIRSSIDYTKSQNQKSNIVNWEFNLDNLILSFNAQPLRIYAELPWKVMVIGRETWGFSPFSDGTWVIPIYSRNVVIRPFRTASGTFDLKDHKFSD